jgi:uncharacterized protein (TIGR02266 family)
VVGYNHNILHLGWEFHLQTEDSGVENPHLITHLFHAGTILASKKLVYDPSSGPEFVKDLMQAQHKAVLRELKAGGHDDKIRQILGEPPAGASKGTMLRKDGGDATAAPRGNGLASPPASEPPPTDERTADLSPPAPETRSMVASSGLEWAALIPTSMAGPASAPTAHVQAPQPPPPPPPAPTLIPQPSEPPAPAAAQDEPPLVQGQFVEPPVRSTSSATLPMFPAVSGPQSNPMISAPPGTASLPPAPGNFVRRDTAPPFASATPAAGQPAGWGFKEERTPLPFGGNAHPLGDTTYTTHRKVAERVFPSVPPPPGAPGSATPRATEHSSTSHVMVNRRVNPSGFDSRTPTPVFPGSSIPVLLPNLAAFLDAYFPGGDAGGILVDAHLDVDLGHPVALVLRFDDGGAGAPRAVEVKGRVAWRRRRGSGNLKAGTGVEFSAADKTTVERLLSDARGQSRKPAERRHDRAEARLMVRIAYGNDSRKDTVDDISEGGLFVATREPIPVGEEVMVTLKPARALRGLDVRGRITWHRDGASAGMGVMFLFDDEGHKERVEQMVARLIAEGL